MGESLEIEGPTLTLRYATQADAERMFELGTDEETMKYLSWGPYTEISQPEAFIEGMAGQRERGEELGLLITRNGQALGVTAFMEPRPRDRSVVIGTWLHRDYWGTGVNFESKALMAALAFRAMGVERLSVYAAVTNARSRGALGKVGFTEEGILRRFHLHGDTWHDLVVGSILRDEWEAGPLISVPAEIRGEPPANWVYGT
jgi:[ribosomal protein S5]-alanine N-acetyltransferase